MSKLDGLYADRNPVKQFLYYENVWSNYFGCNEGNTKYELSLGTGLEPSAISFVQISGRALARWEDEER